MGDVPVSALFEKPGRWLPYVLIVAVAGILVWRAESQNSAQDSHTRSFGGNRARGDVRCDRGAGRSVRIVLAA